MKEGTVALSLSGIDKKEELRANWCYLKQ